MILLADIGVRIALYASLAIALNLVVGHSGLLLLCQSIYLGLGAYVAAICLASDIGLAASAAAAISVATLGAALSFVPLLSLRRDAFAVASLALSLCFVGLLNNLEWLTNGPDGISVPRPSLYHGAPLDTWALLIGALACLFAAVALSRFIIGLPFGRALHAVRSDELSARALGIRPWTFLIRAATACGAITGTAGVLFAAYVGHLTPETFSLDLTITVLAAAIVGGLGSSLGAIIATSGLVLVSEILRSAFPSLAVADVDRLVFGLVLLLVLRYFPNGLLGDTRLR